MLVLTEAWLGYKWENSEIKKKEKEKRYHESIQDKERYRAEMEDYREKQKMGQVISDAVPLQQRLPEPDADMLDVDIKMDEAEGDSPQTPEESSG